MTLGWVKLQLVLVELALAYFADSLAILKLY